MFKSNFTRICADKGISPSRVLTDLGYSSSVYSEWTETTVPRNKTIVKLAEYLGVTVDELTGDAVPKATDILTDREKSLLDAFRRLPPASQDALLALVKSYDASPGGSGNRQ